MGKGGAMYKGKGKGVEKGQGVKGKLEARPQGKGGRCGKDKDKGKQTKGPGGLSPCPPAETWRLVPLAAFEYFDDERLVYEAPFCNPGAFGDAAIVGLTTTCHTFADHLRDVWRSVFRKLAELEQTRLEFQMRVT